MAGALVPSESGGYQLSEDKLLELEASGVWGLLLDDRSGKILWSTGAVPDGLPEAFTLSDTASLTRGYLKDFPAFPARSQYGLVVLGYPKNSYWKHMYSSWDYNLIKNSPSILLFFFLGNITVIFLIYMAANTKLFASVSPLLRAIAALSEGESIHLKETGALSELASAINRTSEILQGLEYNMQPLHMQKVNLVACVRQVAVDFLNLDPDGRYPCCWMTADTYTRQLDGDPILLKRAVSNLIQNSINHNPDGCSIYLTLFSARDGQAVICVEDDGKGVSQSQMEKLNHTPHYMVCDENASEQRHGLGLLLVKQIAAAHNGSVVMEKSSYGGFRVSILLPG